MVVGTAFFRLYFSIFFLFSIFSLGARQTIKDYALFCTQERVNDRLFARRVEVVSGVKTACYQIDNQDVASEVFEEQLLHAEGQERLQQLRNEAVNVGAREHEKQQTRILVLRKLLSQLVDRCKKDLFLLEKFSLERYFAFDAETLTRDAYELVVTKLIPEADAACNEGGDLAVVEQLYSDLESYEKRVNAFVFSTVRQAINACDDARLLKDLLAAISA